MRQFKIIGLILVLSSAGQAFGAAATGAAHNIDQEIIQRLRDNDPSLTRLHLSNNQIGDEGARALADALRTNTSLTELYLQANQIGKEGTLDLAEALRTNTSLTGLSLEYNQIGDELKQEIARLMSPEEVQERRRRALVPWSIPRHLQLASWNPHVAPVVKTIFFIELLSRQEGFHLPYLPIEIWLKILELLNCGDFDPRALLAP